MDVKGIFRQLKGLAKSGKLGNKGFTLLELLVVVAILAAIAGTATIALKDTDARASAAAHVAMMDELNKGIGTYRVLRRNEFPNYLDSLMQIGADTKDAVRAGSTATGAGTPAQYDELFDWDEKSEDVAYGPLNKDAVANLKAIGINTLMYIDRNLTKNEYNPNTCGDLQSLINARNNDVVPGNLFMTPEANGCGKRMALEEGSKVTYWAGGSERLTGHPDFAADGVTPLAHPLSKGATAYLMTGLGPSATLFDQNTLGGMTTVPVYRHVKPDQYNRFIAVWNVGKCNADGTIATNTNPGVMCTYDSTEVDLTAIIDGALDTKEEELGEWDGTRNTL